MMIVRAVLHTNARVESLQIRKALQALTQGLGAAGASAFSLSFFASFSFSLTGL
jgi:hypothetical protein